MHIHFGMSKSDERLPSIRSLVAFERFARVGNVTQVAEELTTSQAAISRHLKRLQDELGVALVKPSGRGIVLTNDGFNYAQEISAALEQLRKAGNRLSGRKNELTIACTHEVSHLIIMPHYSRLKKALGPNASIRIMTSEYQALASMIDAGADIVFRYSETLPVEYSAAILEEAIMPVASPSLLRKFGDKLRKTPDQWSGVPRLFLSKLNLGWATWEDWFAWQKMTEPDAPQLGFDNYVYALEAAARDEGLVLAWRGFADQYLETGQLVSVGPEWSKSRSRLFAIDTGNKKSGSLAKKFISTLSALVGGA